MPEQISTRSPYIEFLTQTIFFSLNPKIHKIRQQIESSTDGIKKVNSFPLIILQDITITFSQMETFRHTYELNTKYPQLKKKHRQSTDEGMD